MGCGARTFGAAFTALNAGTAATTAVAELSSPGTKKIRLLKMVVSGIEATALATNDVRLVKQSTVSVGGTSTTATATPFASNYGVAPTGLFKGYTVAPTTQGTLVGILGDQKLSLILATTGSVVAVVFDFQFLPAFSRPTLLTAAESIALDLNGATPANAPSLDIYAWWTEEPLNS